MTRAHAKRLSLHTPLISPDSWITSENAVIVFSCCPDESLRSHAALCRNHPRHQLNLLNEIF